MIGIWRHGISLGLNNSASIPAHFSLSFLAYNAEFQVPQYVIQEIRKPLSSSSGQTASLHGFIITCPKLALKPQRCYQSTLRNTQVSAQVFLLSYFG